MNCISANCRGLGNQPAVRELRGFVKQLDPTLLFVTETKIPGKRVEKLTSTFGFSAAFAMDSDGLSGGLGLFWSSVVTVDIKSFNLHHIDAVVQLRMVLFLLGGLRAFMENIVGRTDT